MTLADSIGKPGQSEGKDTHTEVLVTLPQIQALMEIEGQLLAKPTEGLLHQRNREAVMPGNDRSMGREDCLLPDLFKGLVKIASRGAQLAHELESCQGSMSFIEVEDTGLISQRPQHTYSTDP